MCVLECAWWCRIELTWAERLQCGLLWLRHRSAAQANGVLGPLIRCKQANLHPAEIVGPAGLAVVEMYRTPLSASPLENHVDRLNVVTACQALPTGETRPRVQHRSTCSATRDRTRPWSVNRSEIRTAVIANGAYPLVPVSSNAATRTECSVETVPAIGVDRQLERHASDGGKRC